MQTTAFETYCTIQAEQKRIKDLKAKGADLSTNDALRKELSELQSSVRKKFRILILSHPRFCHQQDTNVVNQLWKKCFYTQIEDFRKTIKRLKSHFASNSTEEDARIKEHIVRFQENFDHFLVYGIQFFEKLMLELEKKATETDPTASLEVSYYAQQIPRCLLYLSDLSRYQELYSTREPKEFTKSVRYSERAALLLPASGLPHNQLAMLSTYGEDQCTALYHYGRSILCQDAFTGGYENMAKMFAMHKPLPTPPHNADLKCRQSYLLSQFVALQGFLFGWSIRMHSEYAALQSVNNNSKQSTESGNNATTSTTTLLQSLNDMLGSTVLKGRKERDMHSDFQSLLMPMLAVFDEKLLSEIQLLRLITICIFSVHFAESPFAVQSDSQESVSDGLNLSSFASHSASVFDVYQLASQSTAGSPATSQQSVDSYPRSRIQSFALAALFSLLSHAMSSLEKSAKQEGSTSHWDKLLSCTSVGCDWLSLHMNFWQPAVLFEWPAEDDNDIVLPSVFLAVPTSSKVFRNEKTPELIWKRKYLADEESASLAKDFQHKFRSHLSDFVTESSAFDRGVSKPSRQRLFDPKKDSTVSNLVRKTDEDSVANTEQFVLREHAELRGFLPVAVMYEESFANFNPLRNTIKWLPKGHSRSNRQGRVLMFLNAVSNLEQCQKQSSESTTTAPEVAVDKSIVDNKSVRDSSAVEASAVPNEKPLIQNEKPLIQSDVSAVNENDDDIGDIFEDLDDVVFQPGFLRCFTSTAVDSTANGLHSPFDSPTPGLESSFSQLSTNAVFQGSVLSSLGVTPSNSYSQLSGLDGITKFDDSFYGNNNVVNHAPTSLDYILGPASISAGQNNSFSLLESIGGSNTNTHAAQSSVFQSLFGNSSSSADLPFFNLGSSALTDDLGLNSTSSVGRSAPPPGLAKPSAHANTQSNSSKTPPVIDAAANRESTAQLEDLWS